MLRREGLRCSIRHKIQPGRAPVQGGGGDRKVTFSEDGGMLLGQTFSVEARLQLGRVDRCSGIFRPELNQDHEALVEVAAGALFRAAKDGGRLRISSCTPAGRAASHFPQAAVQQTARG